MSDTNSPSRRELSEDYTGDLKKRLRSYGISHGALCRQIGILESQMSRWFNKPMQPGLANVRKIEAAVRAIRARNAAPRKRGVAPGDSSYTKVSSSKVRKPRSTPAKHPSAKNSPAPIAPPPHSLCSCVESVQGQNVTARRSNPSIAPLALNQREASIALGLSPESRWLDHAPIPWVDIRKPGGKQPCRRWRVKDLERFLLERVVAPGRDSPFGDQ